MKMREDPSDEMEELLLDQGKVAYRPDIKKETAPSAVGRATKQPIRSSRSAPEAEPQKPDDAEKKVEGTSQGQQPVKLLARRVQAKKEQLAEEEEAILIEKKPLPPVTLSSAVTRPRRGGSGAEPAVVGVIKGPVDETAVSDKEEPETKTATVAALPPLTIPAQIPSASSDPAPSGSKLPPPSTSSTSPGQRRSRRSRSSVSEADPPKGAECS
jgi:hypothetical protein